MPHRAPRTNTATTGHITLAGPVAKRTGSDRANASGKAGPAPGIPPGVAYTPQLAQWVWLAPQWVFGTQPQPGLGLVKTATPTKLATPGVYSRPCSATQRSWRS